MPLDQGITVAFTNGTPSPSFRLNETWSIYVRPDLSQPVTAAMATRLENGKVICSTCHDQHSQAAPPFDPSAPAYGGAGTGAGRDFQRVAGDTDQGCKECHNARNVASAASGSRRERSLQTIDALSGSFWISVPGSVVTTRPGPFESGGRTSPTAAPSTNSISPHRTSSGSMRRNRTASSAVAPFEISTARMLRQQHSVVGEHRPSSTAPILSGMGGQTALNICSELSERGILERLGLELLGSQPRAIALSEDRELFRKTMLELSEPIPRSMTTNSIDGAKKAVQEIGGYAVLVRPAFTLGGTGGGIAYFEEDLVNIVGRGLIYSRIRQVLIEESVIGWKEFEYEVMRDKNDNCIIICSMENLDPMGIHTGESIVVAPVQTLNDVDHQRLRTASIKIIRALGIEGGCNVQFALDPVTKEHRVIEVNPRVSRSSALASKATGYPIARVAAKIAIGKTLDEIQNKITGKTSAAFEPREALAVAHAAGLEV